MVLGGYATAPVAQPDRHARRVGIGSGDGTSGRDVLRVAGLALALERDACGTIAVGGREPVVFRCRRDGHFDWLSLVPGLHGRTECILKQLGDDVLKVNGDVGDAGVWVAGNDEGRPDAVVELANVGDVGLAGGDYAGGLESGVDDADVAGLALGLARLLRGVV